MTRHILITILVFCFSSTFGQKKDSVYKYDVCIHQNLTPGTAYKLNEIIITREDKTPYIEGIVLDLNKNRILSSTVTLTQSETDSIVRRITLDSTNHFSFDNLTPGKYDVLVNSKNYVASKITKISVDKEFALPFVFKLGNNDMYIMTTITSNKKLSDKKIKQRTKELEDELNK